MAEAEAQNRPSVLLNSTPAGAKILVNGTYKGVTPLEYDYDLDDGCKLDFRFELTDYQSEKLTIRAIEKKGKSLINAFLFHLPGLFSKQSASDYTLPEKGINMQLFKTNEKELVPVKLPKVDAAFELKQKEYIGMLDGKRLTYDTKSGRDILRPEEDLERYMSKGFYGTWLSDVPILLGTNQSEKFLMSSIYYLKPVIKSILADLKSKKRNVRGTVELGIDWEFYRADSIEILAFAIE